MPRKRPLLIRALTEICIRFSNVRSSRDGIHNTEGDGDCDSYSQSETRQMFLRREAGIKAPSRLKQRWGTTGVIYVTMMDSTSLTFSFTHVHRNLWNTATTVVAIRNCHLHMRLTQWITSKACLVNIREARMRSNEPLTSNIHS
jgi:hypothetical protein